MFKHYLIAAWRNLKRHKLVSFIQIAGLSLGLATFILGARYVQFEKSYDKYHHNFERIYRVQSYRASDISAVSTTTSYPIAQYLSNTFPEIEKAINIYRIGDELLSANPEITFLEEKGYCADSKVFSFFNFEFIEGDPAMCLDNPNAIVLTESLARKLFPNQKVIGKTIKSDKSTELVVTALIKDVPQNTHILPSYFVSSKQRLKPNMDNWGFENLATYVLIRPNVKLEEVNAKIRTVLNDIVENNPPQLFLQALEQLHINPDNTGELAVVLYMISAIVILILVLSLVNFMNLSTAYSSVRSREIGVRKVNGSNRKMLRVQFLFESIFYAFIAMVLAIIIAKWAINTFNNIVDREISLDYLSSPGLLVLIVLVTFLTGFLSGIYPAYIISSFKPVAAIKGLTPFNNKKGKANGLKTMVLIQFVLSSILIYSSTWIYTQVNYLQDKDLGFDKENLLHLKIQQKETTISYSDFKNRVLSHPGIEQVSISENSPLCQRYGSYIYFEGHDESSTTNVGLNWVNAEFISIMNIKLLHGRNFYENIEQNTGTCIINETAVKAAGWVDTPIGKWVNVWDEKYKVIGIIKDFHASDMHNKIRSYIMLPSIENMSDYNTLIFKVHPNLAASSHEHIKQVYSEAYPGHLFQINTYDEAIDKTVVEIWTSTRNTTGFFTIIAILIAVFALFALVVFAVQKRNKEIGIRKVQGAKSFQVYTLIIKEFVFIVLLANIIALPIPEILAGTMPGAYKYHLQVHEYTFVFLFSLFVALTAGSYHAFRASNKNPVEALQYE